MNELLVRVRSSNRYCSPPLHRSASRLAARLLQCLRCCPLSERVAFGKSSRARDCGSRRRRPRRSNRSRRSPERACRRSSRPDDVRRPSDRNRLSRAGPTSWRHPRPRSASPPMTSKLRLSADPACRSGAAWWRSQEPSTAPSQSQDRSSAQLPPLGRSLASIGEIV